MPAADPTAPRTILFVEDEILIAMVAGEMIADLGYKVLEAGSGAQALKILESDATVDLLITDYSMPRMTGAELVKAARGLRPGLPVLIATGYSELPEGGGAGVPRLNKPYQQAQLRAAIEKLLGAP
ncbi:response regulator [Roseococcus sp. SYP-B2431]|uniref:response regulator n=1 Tax=Roseococcus sp. SYP-B2431 TaxID=2496640 RepID=UPI0013F3D2FA|nr:response regulator [Roseococcus sp. SYP-B2431]